MLRSRLGDDPLPLIDELLHDYAIEVVAFTDRHWREAIAAHGRFGKGHHPAALNFGDCLSYATARVANRPLAFVGGDFPRTDIEAALPVR